MSCKQDWPPIAPSIDDVEDLVALPSIPVRLPALCLQLLLVHESEMYVLRTASVSCGFVAGGLLHSCYACAGTTELKHVMVFDRLPVVADNY